MGIVSEKTKNIPKSMIREMFAMQAGLDDVVSFTLGEPDFDTPQHIIDAVIASLKRGETHYVANMGIPALRKEIAKSYQSRGYDYSEDEIIVSAGATNILLLAATAMLDIGDEVLIQDPAYANDRGIISQVGAVPVPVPVYEENGFMYDREGLEKALTAKTKAIILNSPSNPTRAVASKENLEMIAAFAKAHDLYIISDEIYRELLYADEPYESIAGLEGMKERTLVVDGFSKSYAMTGFRLGYAAGPRELIEAMTKLIENTVSCVNESIQWGGVAALQGSQECVKEMREQYIRRKNLIVEGLNAIPGITCAEPKGAFYAFANIKELGLSSRDFAMQLLQKKRVAVVPGKGFGDHGEGYIRLSYATKEELIQEGLRRIAEFVKEIKK